jgi:hypothetical protein
VGAGFGVILVMRAARSKPGEAAMAWAALGPLPFRAYRLSFPEARRQYLRG